ncbi:MAG: 1-phosphofructokinase family hexose kinase [Chitinispirillia bacterium]
MIYCTVFNPSLDIIYIVDELQPGNTLTDVKSIINPAGKGINVAKVINSLGEEVKVIGLMPEYDMQRFSNYLNNLNIENYFYSVNGNARINSTFLEKSTGQVMHINSTDYNWSIRIQEEFLDFIEKFIQTDDIWALSGSIPQGFEVDTYNKVINRCQKKNNRVMLDSRGLALNMGIRAKPSIIKPNLAELEAFFGEHIEGVHHIALKGKRLLDIGIEFVIISLGSDGMIAIHENDCLICTAPQIEAIDTVGCGDALIAGFLVAQSRNFSFIEACRMGIACGTSNAMHVGPGVIDKDRIWSIMEEVRIESV